LYSCGKQVSVSPPDAPAPNGYIFIDSYPRGFDIYLNGQDRRRITPDSLNWLSTGSYQITLKKKLFRDSTFIINAVEGVKKSIFVDFSKNLAMYGSISCTSNPEGAQISINDSSTGQFTPSIVKNILPGNYVIKYHLNNYQDVGLNVTISSGQTSFLNTWLVDTTIWKEYTTDNSGIKTDDLTCVAVDKNNVIWLGTNDGVISFDGTNWGGEELYSILPYWPLPSVPTQKPVHCITIDGSNTKLFGMDAGFATYDGINENSYGPYGSPPPLPNAHVNAIGFDNAGNWYVGTDSGLTKVSLAGVYRSFTLYNYNNSNLRAYWITAVFGDKSGNIWVGTRDNGIYTINADSSFGLVNTSNSPIINNYIRAFAQGPDGNIWVGFGTSVVNGGELAVYDGSSWQNFYGLKSTVQTAQILIDKNNVKWVATDGGLVKFISSSNLINLNYDNTGLNINNVTGVAQDSKGNIWLSTYGGGLVEYKGNH
jgi:ligand-binding sensor domain-containing protein